MESDLSRGQVGGPLPPCLRPHWCVLTPALFLPPPWGRHGGSEMASPEAESGDSPSSEKQLVPDAELGGEEHIAWVVLTNT